MTPDLTKSSHPIPAKNEPKAVCKADPKASHAAGLGEYFDAKWYCWTQSGALHPRTVLLPDWLPYRKAPAGGLVPLMDAGPLLKILVQDLRIEFP